MVVMCIHSHCTVQLINDNLGDVLSMMVTGGLSNRAWAHDRVQVINIIGLLAVYDTFTLSTGTTASLTTHACK
jgi:hypothetical protein